MSGRDLSISDHFDSWFQEFQSLSDLPKISPTKYRPKWEISHPLFSMKRMRGKDISCPNIHFFMHEASQSEVQKHQSPPPIESYQNPALKRVPNVSQLHHRAEKSQNNDFRMLSCTKKWILGQDISLPFILFMENRGHEISHFGRYLAGQILFRETI